MLSLGSSSSLFPPHTRQLHWYLEQLLLRYFFGQISREGLDPYFFTGLDFGTNVRLRVAPRSHEHDGESRGFPSRGGGELFDALGDLAADGSGDGLAVDYGGG